MSGPTEAVRAAFDALDAGDHRRLVDLVDREALERFKSAQVALVEWEAQIAHDAEPSQRRNSFLRAVFKVHSMEELRALAAPEMLRRWLGVSAGKPPTQAIRRTILGEVAESASIVHVVFREAATDAPPPGLDMVVPTSTVRVISTIQGPAGWRVMLNGGIVYDDAGGSGIGFGDDADE